MRTQLTHLARTAATVITLGVALAACSGGSTNDATLDRPVIADAAPEPTEIAVLVPELPHCCPASTDADEADPQGDASVPLLASERTPLQQLFYARPPKGTGPEIALRFLRALQRHDHLAAAHELFVPGRDYFGKRDQATLDRVMRDIAANARLQGAGDCTRSERLNREAAVVTCGRQKVVVHVLDHVGSGVQIAKWHPAYDVYRGPHTHAFTTDDLS